MANAKAILEILGEDRTAAAWKSAVGKAGAASQQINASMKSAFNIGPMAAVAAVAGVVETLRRVGMASIEMGDNLNKAAIKAGVSGQTISELAHAAKMADVDLAALSTGLKKMQVALVEARAGGKDQNETLAALGLTFRQLQELKPDQQFELIAERISQLRDPADKVTAATKLFGKAGADLLPMFEQGAEGIKKAREEAQRLGLSFSDADLQKFNDADDAIKRVEAQWKALAASLTLNVVPVLTKVMNLMTGSQDKSALESQLKSLEVLKERAAKQGAISKFFTGTEFDIDAAMRDVKAKLAKLNAPASAASAPGGAAGTGGGTPPPGFAPPAATLEEVRVGSQKLKAQSTWDTFLERIDRETMTSTDRMVADYRAKHDQLEVMFAAGLVSEAEFLKRRQAITDDYYNNELAEIHVQTQKIKKAASENDEYIKEAMRGIQSSFKTFVLDPFTGGLRGFALNVVNVFRDIFAEIAAQKLAMALVGKMDDAGNLSGGALSGFINGIFGGFKAEGGPVTAGRAYVVGEKRPELFVPGVSGTIVPRIGGGGGGTPVVINNNIDARGATTDLVKQLPAILEASNQRAVQMAREQIRDDISRGAFRR